MGAHVSVPMYHRSLPQRLRLEGRRCTACKRVYFPPIGDCRQCGGSLEPIELSGRGEIHACTYITAAGAPPEFSEQARRQGGYHVAVIRLAEGPMITAQLTSHADPPPIGAPVRAVIRRLYDEEGVQRYGFKFTAIAGDLEDPSVGSTKEAPAR